MGVSKVVLNTENGEEVLVNLEGDTVAPESLAKGATAHDANGNPITGTMPTTAVLYTEQSLTSEEKAQACENIAAVSDSVFFHITGIEENGTKHDYVVYGYKQGGGGANDPI